MAHRNQADFNPFAQPWSFFPRKLSFILTESTIYGTDDRFCHFDKFLEMSIRCEEISKELDEIEPELKRLKTMMDIKTFLIIFFKNSVFILSIILFAGIIIFPALVYYLNTFSPEFNISTAGDTGFYHKYFIIFGVVGGLFFSFFKSFQSFLKK